MEQVTIIGAGLAGSEAAWQVAQAGIRVKLYEMRPQRMTPAHQTNLFAELVCSNSLRADNLENAVGLLKAEMRCLNSLIMAAADNNQVPAGGALAVDREAFSSFVTQQLQEHPLVDVVTQEVVELPTGVTVVASGPLTADPLADAIQKFTGDSGLYFYDAAAPIVNADSLNLDVVYRASRYDKGGADYLNCPMNREEYELFWTELVNAQTAPLKAFEQQHCFEGCMPIEVMAKRGIDTLRFGPLKPVGLPDPRSGEIPWAVVQLRQDNAAASLYNLVGFQTNLKWPEQQRVLRLIPGLGSAEFARFGVMHRNTYLCSPSLLLPTWQSKQTNKLLFAGQITGVEGYVESAASGLMAGVNAARLIKGKDCLELPRDTALGSLAYYVTHAESQKFQPMNITFGLLPPLGKKIRDKREKNRQIAERSLYSLQKYIEKFDNALA